MTEMGKSIVQRLRGKAPQGMSDRALCDAAADEIVRLESALRAISVVEPGYTDGKGLFTAREIARYAIGLSDWKAGLE